VLKFRETLIRICGFIDEDVNDALLTWHQHTTVRNHPAWPTAVADVHSSSIGKWRMDEYRELVAEMMADRAAVGLLKRYEYLDRNAQAVGVWKPNFLIRRIKRRIPVSIKAKLKGIMKGSPT
jgi:hypothetical protein